MVDTLNNFIRFALCVQKCNCYTPVGPWGSWESIELQRGGILHSRREEMPAVKAANVNSCTVFMCPKGFHRKALEVSLPCSSSKVSSGLEEWDLFPFVFLLHWLGEAGRALGLLLQHPSVLEYRLTLLGAWLTVLLRNFMVSELRCCAC